MGVTVVRSLLLLAWLYATLGGDAYAVSAISSAPTQEKVALVVGNGSYRIAPLNNPKNDATAMGDLLTRAGFDVSRHIDTSQANLQAAMEQFGKRIQNPNVKFAIFYYAGHAVQLNWTNYLIPVDAQIHSADELRKQSVDVTDVIRYMKDAKNKSYLIILDACREDPFAGNYRPQEKGLSQFDAPPGSLLAYATAPGKVAKDGAGANGLYTSHLLQEMAVQDAKLEDVFKRVRLSVRLESGGLQIPWETTSLEDDVYLFPSKRRELSETERDALYDREVMAWKQAKSSNDLKDLTQFIREFPSGNASELAQSRLSRLLVAQADQKSRAEAVEREKVSDRQAQEALKLEVQRPDTSPPQPVQEASAPVLLALAATPHSQGYVDNMRRFTVGDEYDFRVIDQFTKLEKPLKYRVSQVNPVIDQVEYNGGEYLSDLMGNMVRNVRGNMDTPRQFYPAEFYVGKKWKTRFKQVRPGGTTYTFAYDLKIVGKETVTVPAGTFDTYKIEARGFNVNLAAYLQRTIWIAPSVNADIIHETFVRLASGRVEQNDRQELVRYQVAPVPVAHQ
jgi:hypothetical protein